MNREQKAILASTPGHILKQEFLDGFGLSQLELSKRTGIPRSTINEIVKGKRPINAETAYALGLFFRMEPQFWINLQSRYDLRRVELEKADSIRARVQPLTV
ncbi:MAG: HigA family addiction module antitoxin [Luteolibacter sp.]